jgi:peptidoglycan/xylan/chitin deacetylase (PgdA/CDA1 family)
VPKSKKKRTNLWALLLLITAVSVLLGLLIHPQQPVNKAKTSFAEVLKHTSTPTPSPKVEAQIPAQSGKSTSIPILYYHYIAENPNPADTARDSLSLSPNKFEEQMKYLSENGYSTISLDTLYSIMMGETPRPAKPVVLTFDDGYIDFYINAYPIMRRYNIHSVAFIPTGLMGGGYYMSWEQIKEMQSSGLVNFQPHSINHPYLPTLSTESMTYQVEESKRVLEQNLGIKTNFFAYPYGASNSQTWQAVKNAGFVGAVGTWPGILQSEGVIFNLPRLRVPGGATLDQFKKLI